MYNSLFGFNPISLFVLTALGFDYKDQKTLDGFRFRDAYLSKDGTRMLLFTRVGGGNRESYEEAIDNLRNHELYLTDYDDDFDLTYATFEFDIPDNLKDACKLLSMHPAFILTGPEKFKKALESMEKEVEE